MCEAETAFIDRIREGSETWDPEEVIRELGLAERLAESLVDLSLGNPDLFDAAYPIYYRLFVDRVDRPTKTLLPFYRAIVSTLHVRGDLGRDELELLKDTCRAALAISVNRDAYRELVQDLRGILSSVRAPRTVDWALDICEELAVATCLDDEARLQFVSVVASMVREFAARLTPPEHSDQRVPTGLQGRHRSSHLKGRLSTGQC